jgi:hypothetical protein
MEHGRSLDDGMKLDKRVRIVKGNMEATERQRTSDCVKGDTQDAAWAGEPVSRSEVENEEGGKCKESAHVPALEQNMQNTAAEATLFNTHPAHTEAAAARRTALERRLAAINARLFAIRPIASQRPLKRPLPPIGSEVGGHGMEEKGSEVVFPKVLKRKQNTDLTECKLQGP